MRVAAEKEALAFLGLEEKCPLLVGKAERSLNNINRGISLLHEKLHGTIQQNRASVLACEKVLCILSNQSQMEVILACASREIGQEAATFWELHERPGFIDQQQARARVFFPAYLLPYKLGDEKECHTAQLVLAVCVFRQIAQVEDHQRIIQFNLCLGREAV